jgi:hypothetical protein
MNTKIVIDIVSYICYGDYMKNKLDVLADNIIQTKL